MRNRFALVSTLDQMENNYFILPDGKRDFFRNSAQSIWGFMHVFTNRFFTEPITHPVFEYFSIPSFFAIGFHRKHFSFGLTGFFSFMWILAESYGKIPQNVLERRGNNGKKQVEIAPKSRYTGNMRKVMSTSMGGADSWQRSK